MHLIVCVGVCVYTNTCTQIHVQTYTQIDALCIQICNCNNINQILVVFIDADTCNSVIMYINMYLPY